MPATIGEASWRGTPALTRSCPTPGSERRFIVGDAAGYVEPFTGEGMAWAIMSAVALAPIAARGVLNWSPELVEQWKQTLGTVVQKRQRLCRIVSRVLRSPVLTKATVEALRVCPGLSRLVLASLNTPYSPSRHA